MVDAARFLFMWKKPGNVRLLAVGYRLRRGSSRRSVTVLQSSRNLCQRWVWLSENVGFWLMNGNQAVTRVLPKPSYTGEEIRRVFWLGNEGTSWTNILDYVHD